MTLIALVRVPSPTLCDGERTHIERTPINLALARNQHTQYAEALRHAGATIVNVEPAPHLPDAVFIEDTAVVLDSLTVIARSSVLARRAELPSVAAALSHFCHLTTTPAAAYFDGGDVLAIDRTVYIGRTARTNGAAIDFLSTLLRQYDYEIVTVPVTGCLHLKTAVTSLGHNTVLINPKWVPAQAFARHRQIAVDPDEPMGANALRVGNHLMMSVSYPRTARRVEAQGFKPQLIDIEEFHHAEGGLTGLSILFTTSGLT